MRRIYRKSRRVSKIPSNKVPRNHAVPVFRKDPLVALVGIEFRAQEKLGGRGGENGSRVRGDAPVVALEAPFPKRFAAHRAEIIALIGVPLFGLAPDDKVDFRNVPQAF